MNKEIHKFLAANLDADTLEMTPVKKGGSDRCFFRISLPDKNSFIFMQYGEEKGENVYWIGIDNFLQSIAVTVPVIIAHDPRMHFVLMEDLGDVDLWSLRELPWPKRRNYYYQVLDIAYKMHSFPLSELPTDLKIMEGYDNKLYHWEQNYFLENFVEAVCHLNLDSRFKKNLEKEFIDLMVRLQQVPLCLIHRDFQSQNIIIKNDLRVLIDFQGMREGNFFYDLGSLLCDPYVSFTAGEMSELLYFYYENVKQIYSWNDFENNFWDATAQRLMQALGAYGFLGLKKNKPAFLHHGKKGIENLINATIQAKNLPLLHELAKKCAAVEN